MIEPLESRKLLAGVTLRDGVLTINGTDGDDVVGIAKSRVLETTATGGRFFVEHIDVSLNTEFLGNFRVPDFGIVKVRLKGGNDELLVGQKNFRFDIDGGDGDDTIGGGQGGDIIRGGAGRNVIYGKQGNDRFFISSGGDIVFGGSGLDTADFSAFETGLIITLDGVANDSEVGRQGNVMPDIETIIGGGGPDLIDATGILNPVSIIGNSGKDTLFGGARADTLKGGPGNDELHGAALADYLNGNGGKDTLFGEGGADTLNGGGPDPEILPLPFPQPLDPDTLGGGGDGVRDTLDGGADPDTDVGIIDSFDYLRAIP